MFCKNIYFVTKADDKVHDIVINTSGYENEESFPNAKNIKTIDIDKDDKICIYPYLDSVYEIITSYIKNKRSVTIYSTSPGYSGLSFIIYYLMNTYHKQYEIIKKYVEKYYGYKINLYHSQQLKAIDPRRKTI
jgi:hypothetical protein